MTASFYLEKWPHETSLALTIIYCPYIRVRDIDFASIAQLNFVTVATVLWFCIVLFYWHTTLFIFVLIPIVS